MSRKRMSLWLLVAAAVLAVAISIVTPLVFPPDGSNPTPANLRMASIVGSAAVATMMWITLVKLKF